MLRSEGTAIADDDELYYRDVSEAPSAESKRALAATLAQYVHGKIYGVNFINAADYATLNDAFAEVGNGDIIILPAQQYVVTSAIVCNAHSVEVIGVGNQNYYSGTYFGPSIHSEVDGGICLLFNNTGGGIHQGPILRNLTFIDDTTSGDGTMLEIRDMARWQLYSCVARSPDSSDVNQGGTGFKFSKSGGQYNSWGMIHECKTIAMDVGFHFAGGDGHTMVGGSAISYANQTGYLVEAGQNIFHGNRWDGVANGNGSVGFKVYSDYNVFSGFQTEQGDYAYDFYSGASGNKVESGLIFAAGTGIRLQSGADDNDIGPVTISSPVSTHISDSGARNNIVTRYTGIKMDAAFAKPIGWTDNVAIYRNAGSPEGVVSAAVGSICMDTTNGVQYNKKTGTGNTGWKLVTQEA